MNLNQNFHACPTKYTMDNTTKANRIPNYVILNAKTIDCSRKEAQTILTISGERDPRLRKSLVKISKSFTSAVWWDGYVHVQRGLIFWQGLNSLLWPLYLVFHKCTAHVICHQHLPPPTPLQKKVPFIPILKNCKRGHWLVASVFSKGHFMNKPSKVVRKKCHIMSVKRGISPDIPKWKNITGSCLDNRLGWEVQFSLLEKQLLSWKLSSCTSWAARKSIPSTHTAKLLILALFSSQLFSNTGDT